MEITFRTRDFAERALRSFPNFHGRPLTLSFNQPLCMTGRQGQQGEEGARRKEESDQAKNQEEVKSSAKGGSSAEMDFDLTEVDDVRHDYIAYCDDIIDLVFGYSLMWCVLFCAML